MLFTRSVEYFTWSEIILRYNMQFLLWSRITKNQRKLDNSKLGSTQQWIQSKWTGWEVGTGQNRSGHYCLQISCLLESMPKIYLIYSYQSSVISVFHDQIWIRWPGPYVCQKGIILTIRMYQKWHFQCPKRKTKTTFIDLITPLNLEKITFATRFGHLKVAFWPFYIFCIF